jgi:hypothetical protein
LMLKEKDFNSIPLLSGRLRDDVIMRTQTHQSICFYQSILGIRRNG